MYSNKCKSTLNSHIKNNHSFNFAKLEINPRKKSLDKLSGYEGQTLEWKKNGLQMKFKICSLRPRKREQAKGQCKERMLRTIKIKEKQIIKKQIKH